MSIKIIIKESKRLVESVDHIIEDSIKKLESYPSVNVKFIEGYDDDRSAYYNRGSDDWDHYTDMSTNAEIRLTSTISISDLGLQEKPLPNYLPARTAERHVNSKLDQMFSKFEQLGASYPGYIYVQFIAEINDPKGKRLAKGKSVGLIEINIGHATLDFYEDSSSMDREEIKELKMQFDKLNKIASAYDKNIEKIKQIIKTNLNKFVYSDHIPEEAWIELRNAEKTSRLGYEERNDLVDKIISKYI